MNKSSSLSIATFVGAVALSFITIPADAAITHLDNLDFLATGTHSITADSQTFDGYVRNDGGTGWLLIGRGRNGWQFDTNGQGGGGGDGVGVVNGTGLGTTAAFGPALYSDAIINDLIGNSSADMTGVEVRLRRASNTTGTAYQEGRWNNWVPTLWTGDLDQGTNIGNLRADWEILNFELGGTFASANSGTRDGLSAGGSPTPANNGQRVFTWAWSGHGNQRGFSYGQTVQGVDGNDPNTFMWEIGSENHAIPYTEVYVRLLNPVPVPEPSSTALLGLGGLALLLGRRR
jgi:hypothetical protein